MTEVIILFCLPCKVCDSQTLNFTGLICSKKLRHLQTNHKQNIPALENGAQKIFLETNTVVFTIKSGF